jgi:hypothetical protein
MSEAKSTIYRGTKRVWDDAEDAGEVAEAAEAAAEPEVDVEEEAPASTGRRRKAS